MEWTIESRSDIRRGEWLEDDYAYVEVQYLIATNSRGNRYEKLLGVIEREQVIEAENAARSVPNFDPTTAEDWYETSPQYGSDAWDSEAEYELACFEADCYDEPRPNWF